METVEGERKIRRWEEEEDRKQYARYPPGNTKTERKEEGGRWRKEVEAELSPEGECVLESVCERERLWVADNKNALGM